MSKRFLLWMGLAAAVMALPAAAQMKYKSIMPDGRTVYGDAPVPGATKVEKLKFDTSDTGVRPPVERETEALRQMQAGRNAREGTERRKEELAEALRRAEAARDAGKEPLPGERVGTAGGGSRLTDAYFARQKQLEQAVDLARRNLDAANNPGGAPQGTGPQPQGFGTPPGSFGTPAGSFGTPPRQQ